MKSLAGSAVQDAVASRPGCSIFYICDLLGAKSRRDMDRVAKKLGDAVRDGHVSCEIGTWGRHYTRTVQS